MDRRVVQRCEHGAAAHGTATDLTTMTRMVDSNKVLSLGTPTVPPEFGRAVVTQGERVYCREPEADHAFVRDAQLRAADLQPFLRRMRRIKLEALRS